MVEAIAAMTEAEVQGELQADQEAMTMTVTPNWTRQSSHHTMQERLKEHHATW